MKVSCRNLQETPWTKCPATSRRFRGRLGPLGSLVLGELASGSEELLDPIELRLDLTGQKIGHDVLDRAALVANLDHVLGDGHPYSRLLAELVDRLTALDSLGDHVHRADDVFDRSPLS